MADEIISYEPATGVVLWRGAIGSADAEVAAARSGWAAWAALPLTVRIETMRRFGNVVRQRHEKPASPCGKRVPRSIR
jgi:succinylglutamic semialdehyde dehydrogenase